MHNPAMMNVERAVIWRRLDVPGMDACRFESGSGGWTIGGTAIFLTDGSVARLTYEVACRSDWSTRTATVSGWLGAKNISISLARSATGDWQLNGSAVEGMSHLVDVDLGFTPATNTSAIRRLDVQPGQEVETTSLWLDTSDWLVKPLRQTYRRKSHDVLAYASPEHQYFADITTDAFGVVVDYPELWASVS
jgi:uncharacterized protein